VPLERLPVFVVDRLNTVQMTTASSDGLKETKSDPTTRAREDAYDSAWWRFVQHPGAGGLVVAEQDRE
jgi:hypothetical protein